MVDLPQQVALGSQSSARAAGLAGRQKRFQPGSRDSVRWLADSVAPASRLQLPNNQRSDLSQRPAPVPWMEKGHRWILGARDNLRDGWRECGSASCAGGKWMGHCLFTRTRCPAHPRPAALPTPGAAGGGPSGGGRAVRTAHPFWPDSLALTRARWMHRGGPARELRSPSAMRGSWRPRGPVAC